LYVVVFQNLFKLQASMIIVYTNSSIDRHLLNELSTKYIFNSHIEKVKNIFWLKNIFLSKYFVQKILCVTWALDGKQIRSTLTLHILYTSFGFQLCLKIPRIKNTLESFTDLEQQTEMIVVESLNFFLKRSNSCKQKILS